jgi:hypothetical protein
MGMNLNALSLHAVSTVTTASGDWLPIQMLANMPGRGASMTFSTGDLDLLFMLILGAASSRANRETQKGN